MQDLKKIPKFIYVLVITIVAVIVFWLTIGQTLLTQAPKMIVEHEANVQLVKEYDEALKIKDEIEKEIKKNQEEFNKTQKELFVDKDTSTEEIEDYSDKNDILLKNYTISEPTTDSKGRVSSAGYPVKTVSISLGFDASYDKSMNFMKYIETGSKGCYYINNCSMSPTKNGGTDESYSVSMSLTLYYYEVPEIETATESAEEK